MVQTQSVDEGGFASRLSNLQNAELRHISAKDLHLAIKNAR
jgi:hypothetical protein